MSIEDPNNPDATSGNGHDPSVPSVNDPDGIDTVNDPNDDIDPQGGDQSNGHKKP